MARKYRLTSWRRVLNRFMKGLIRIGLAPKNVHLLTVRGRKTGKLHTTPVTLVEQGSGRWLVAPYGNVGWVQNARAAGQVTLTRGGLSEHVKITELGAEAAAPILRTYLSQVGIVRPYFDADSEAPVETFVNEAQDHPVFRIDTKP